MVNIEGLIAKLVQFRDERNWKQFHNSKDLAVALNVEAAELLEAFLWKNSEQADKEKIKEELADVLIYCLLLAEAEGLSPTQIIEEKIQKNSEKYPVEKSRGSAKKYNEL